MTFFKFCNVCFFCRNCQKYYMHVALNCNPDCRLEHTLFLNLNKVASYKKNSYMYYFTQIDISAILQIFLIMQLQVFKLRDTKKWSWLFRKALFFYILTNVLDTVNMYVILQKNGFCEKSIYFLPQIASTLRCREKLYFIKQPQTSFGATHIQLPQLRTEKIKKLIAVKRLF